LLAFIDQAQPTAFLGWEHAICLKEGGGSWAGRVREAEESVELHCVEEAHRGLEVLLTFARIPDDDIRRQGQIGQSIPKEPDRLQVALVSVAPPHGRENPVGARLDRQVKVGAERSQ